MTSGGLCVMTAGTVLMQLWSADSSDMHTLEVSSNSCFMYLSIFTFGLPILQVELHIAMLSLVLVLVLSTWMMLLVLQVLVSYWSVLAGQS